MQTPGWRKCVHCKLFFQPDPRNRWHQRYCPKPACRRVSKVVSQRRWRLQPVNKRCYDAEENRRRVKEWQDAHPGYWKKRKKQAVVLRDILVSEATAEPKLGRPDGAVLQDLWSSHPPVVLGLIAHLGGLSYRDDIVAMANRLVARGAALMGELQNDHEKNPLCGASAAGAGPL